MMDTFRLKRVIAEKADYLAEHIKACDEAMKNSLEAGNFALWAFHKGHKLAYEDVLGDFERWLELDND